jgi:uncharacterized protein YqeY
MSLKSDLEAALKQAMRDQDDLRKTTLRGALSAVKLAEVDKQDQLDEAELQRILQKEVKSRRESIEDAKKAGREDLIAEAEAEMAILEAFLPKGLSDAELSALVEEAIAEVGATSPGDMGSVMKAVMAKVAGRADGGQISQIVRQKLQSN